MYLPAGLIGQFPIRAAIAIALGAQTLPATAPTSAPTTIPTTQPATTKSTASTTSTAPTTAPATTPATAPATAPALDQSAPKALLRSFFASRGEVDEATIRSLLHASNPVEQRVLDAVVQVELANSRLRAAEREKFGKATTAPSVAATLEPTSLSELDSFVEKIDGEHATVSTPRVPGVAMEFVRVGGKWKLPISSLVGKLDPTIADSMGVATRAQIEIIDKLTGEVRAGTLKTEEQVRAELTSRLAARIAATRATTQPATHPTTAPTTQAH